MRKSFWTLILVLTGIMYCSAQVSNLELVNPFIGTGGHGHTFPGATVPYGMVQLSPDTRLNGWDACSGYHASDDAILGFSHTHLSGTGIGDYGDVLFMPTTGQQQLNQGTAEKPDEGYASPKTPGSEIASPGYYSVRLSDYNIKVELTATAHAGFHKYTFPANAKNPGVIVDIGHTLQSHRNEIARIEVINDHEIRGHKVTNGWARDHQVYFHAVFSKPFTYKQEGSKGLLQFKKLSGNEVFVKVGISSVDYAGAKNNVMKEIADWKFESVRADAVKQWSTWLNRIDVKGGTLDQRKIFYTALYHSAISPNLFTDVDGRYRGMDKKTHQAAKGSENYTVFSLWDTFRAFHPLMTIVNPSMNEAWIRAMLEKYDESGTLPMWELASNETGTMIGYNAVPVIVDSYMKGYRNFDVQKAYKAIVHASTYDSTIAFADDEVKRGIMPMAKYYNEKLGFIPADKENESVSKALEFAYNDWCIAQMAKDLGDEAGYKKFFERSKRYARYYDAKTGFMRGVNANGTWKTPFNPRFSNHRKDDYVEGNAWQWSWFVPHDVPGLMALHGGREQFLTKLDSLFDVSSVVDGENSSADISGLIGQYAHGNEPSHHISYLYTHAGQPWKTQHLVDSVLQTLYFNDANGLSGNEDCGQMSAWFILSSLGVYQIAPGNPVYTLGRPLFDEVTIYLENGKNFTVRAINNSAKNKYVSEVKLNGVKLKDNFINHSDITSGSTLEFTMTDKPLEVASAKPVYPSYNKLVMAGYQGWHAAEGDVSKRGWYHYEKKGCGFLPGCTNVDLWPDMNEYQVKYKTSFKYPDGSNAYVYSPADESTVDTHFKWMKDYGLDGVHMQRFVGEVRNPKGKNHFNKVLDNALKAAKKYNRAISVMYDLSGCSSSDIPFIETDLNELIETFDLLNSTANPTYLHHNGKPLVTLWGVGFNDNRKYTIEDVDKLVDKLNATNKVSIMLGVPYFWRTLGNDTEKNESLHKLIRKVDIIMPWAVGRFNISGYKEVNVAEDVRWCKENGVDYVPLVFPGFSWANMHNNPKIYNQIPRLKGDFLWKQISGAKSAGAQSLYVAMFDEIDEGTAIYKVSNENHVPLNGDTGLKFVGVEESLPTDYYLWLIGQGANWFHDEGNYDAAKPARK
jgi:predicted alpha-1,2-mannosidase